MMRRWFRNLFANQAEHSIVPPADLVPAEGTAPVRLRIPDRCKLKVDQIQAEIAELLVRLAQQRMDFEHAEVCRIRDQHLPNLFLAYNAISPRHRSRIWLETGHSASFMLNDRLDAMLAHIRQITAATDSQKIADFHAELRFVDTRYSASDPFGLE